MKRVIALLLLTTLLFAQDQRAPRWVYNGIYLTPIVPNITILNSGYTGFGVTDPLGKVHINGGTGSLATGIVFGNGGTGIYESLDNVLAFAQNGTLVATIDGYGYRTIGGYHFLAGSTSYFGWADRGGVKFTSPSSGNIAITGNIIGAVYFITGTGGSSTDSAFVINSLSGSPRPTLCGTDGDSWYLGITTSDHALLGGAAQYDFDNNLEIGVGAAGVDYTFGVNAETNDALATFMEDEDRWEVSDSVAIAQDLRVTGKFTALDVNSVVSTSWNNLRDVPAGFADGTDDGTSGSTFADSFGLGTQ